MRRVVAAIVIVLTLFGCGRTDSGMKDAMGLRDTLLKSNGCSFDAVITADYGDDVYTFTMTCNADQDGAITFTVTDPESISGISGTIAEGNGKFTFDEQALLFQLLADDQISPVSAPWFFLRTLRGGYIRACEKKTDGLHMVVDDTYEEDAMQVDIYTDKNRIPIRAEMLYNGRRILSLDIQNFKFL